MSDRAISPATVIIAALSVSNAIQRYSAPKVPTVIIVPSVDYIAATKLTHTNYEKRERVIIPRIQNKPLAL